MSISQNIINRMKNKLLGVCFGLFPLIIYANDSTGYVSTGGIQYIKNKNIAMENEDLYKSGNQVFTVSVAK